MPSPPTASDSTSKPGERDSTSGLVSKVATLQNIKEYAELNWSGTFEDYLNLVRKNPAVTRSAFQRVYDMILSYGQEEYIDNKKRLSRFNFFKDEHHGGRDAIYGRHPTHAPGERAAERGPALRHRAARDPAARAGG